LVVIVLLTLAVRIRLLDMPIERDVGEFAYVAKLMLQGIPPYREAYSNRMPGIYAIYALILILFGKTQIGIHLALLLVNTATVILIFFLAKRLFDNFTGALTAASFAVLSASRAVHGLSANAEHFVVLFAVGGMLLLVSAVGLKRLGLFFWSGLLFGISFMMKHPGLVFIFFGLSYILIERFKTGPVDRDRLISECIRFLFGASLPFGTAALLLVLSGVYMKFWFWAFPYVYEYLITSAPSFNTAFLKTKLLALVSPAGVLWVMVLPGAAALIRDSKIRPRLVFIALLLLFSIFSICPGFYFRAHYFLLILPAASILMAIGMNSLTKIFPGARKAIPIFLILFLLFYPFYKERLFLFRAGPKEAVRATFGPNPFVESPVVADYIKERTSSDDRIAILGSEPQIFFYSDRRSATGYIYTYMLMQPHRFAISMQERMIREIESSNPKFIIFVRIPTSWLPYPNSEKLIFRWFHYYRKDRYGLAGIVDIVPNDETIYRWGEDADGYKPRSEYYLSIFERM
jgi:hypothetical protein